MRLPLLFLSSRHYPVPSTILYGGYYVGPPSMDNDDDRKKHMIFGKECYETRVSLSGGEDFVTLENDETLKKSFPLAQHVIGRVSGMSFVEWGPGSLVSLVALQEGASPVTVCTKENSLVFSETMQLNEISLSSGMSIFGQLYNKSHNKRSDDSRRWHCSRMQLHGCDWIPRNGCTNRGA